MQCHFVKKAQQPAGPSEIHTKNNNSFLFLQLEDSQPSDAPDEQSLPSYMQRPLAIAPIVPGQTVHAHASDKPKRPTYSTALYSPAEMALKVQIKANREHQKKLKVKKIQI